MCNRKCAEKAFCVGFSWKYEMKLDKFVFNVILLEKPHHDNNLLFMTYSIANTKFNGKIPYFRVYLGSRVPTIQDTKMHELPYEGTSQRHLKFWKLYILLAFVPCIMQTWAILFLFLLTVHNFNIFQVRNFANVFIYDIRLSAGALTITVFAGRRVKKIGM